MWRQRAAAARAARLLVLVLAVEAASAQLPSRRAGTCRGPGGMKPSCTGAHISCISSVLCHKGLSPALLPAFMVLRAPTPWLAAGSRQASTMPALLKLRLGKKLTRPSRLQTGPVLDHLKACVTTARGLSTRGLSNRPPAGAVCVLAVCARVR